MEALAGIKVLDISGAATGPVIATNLGSYGATVVRVESMNAPDLLRLSLPYKDGIPGVNRAPFNLYNYNKYSIAIDLTKSKSRQIIDRLVGWADVFTQSLTVGSSLREELGYERVRCIRPDIIYINSTIGGESGPIAEFKGLGHNAAALSGFGHLIGWPDRDEVGIPIAYTDYLAIPLGTIAVLAALDYRRRTGKGQFIELSAYEVGITAIRHVILDYIVNRRNQGKKGNRSSFAVPHGIYRCWGNDRWCAISVSTDEQWEGFCRAIGDPEWTKQTKFATFLNRKANEDELNRLVEAYTSSYSAEAIREKFQHFGVPAGVVNNCKDLLENHPHLAQREAIWSFDHPEVGKVRAWRFVPRLSKTPGRIRMGAPCLGEHTEYICREILNMSDEEFIGLINEEVLK